MFTTRDCGRPNRFHLIFMTLVVALATQAPSAVAMQEDAERPDAPKSRPRVVVVKPVILCNDDGTSPAPHALPKKLVDRVYTTAGLEFVYLEPVHWNHGKARRGEINLNQIVRQGTANGKINRDARVVTLLFVSAVDGKRGPLGRGMQNGNICFVTLGPQGVDSDPDMQAFVVAHEVGHCLNLRHAVDDPAVPNDVPNLQGDGPYDARLAVEGLHDSQRATVLRSPLVNDRIIFHSLVEGRELIVDESWEPYISGLTEDMLRFSVGLKASDPIPQQPETRKQFAIEKHAQMVLEFTATEQALIRKLVTKLRGLTGQQWPCVSRLPWHFIKSDSAFCSGMAHTRGMSILLSQRYLDRMAREESYGLKLLLHEKLHVIQRLNVGRFESLYNDYGLQRIKLADGELQRINACQNPDALNADWAIKLGDSLSMLVTILRQGDGGKLQFQTQYRNLNEQADGTYTLGSAIAGTDALEKWKASFPFQAGHDHPNEISAYLSASLLQSDYLGEGVGDQDSEPIRIKQTRNAFRQIMRIPDAP